MKMLPSEVLMCLVSMMLCTGCSVKEDRDLCPCRLVLDFSEVDVSVIRSADLIMDADDGFVFTDRLETEDFRYDMMVEVPRSFVNVGVWSGVEGMDAGDGLIIPYGEDCPPVYIHSGLLDTRCETLREKVRMRKNHCRMTIVIKNMDKEYEVRLSGNVNGYQPDGTPSAGEFFCGLRPDEDGGCQALLPRQTDNSLIMEIDDGSGVLKMFCIGEYMAESGYDWSAPDLSDITVELDIAFTDITLSIQGWDNSYKFDIVI